MQSQARWLLVVGFAAALGGIAGSAATFVLMNQHLRQSAPTAYYGLAVNAALELDRLELARAPTNTAIVDELERSLDAKVVQLARFEEEVAQADRSPYVYSVIRRIRNYRQQHRSVAQYPAQRELIEQTLKLQLPK